MKVANRIGVVVKLTDVEQQICLMVAESRQKNNRSSGITSRKRSNKSEMSLDVDGFAAEFAFCKLFGTFPDFSIHTRSSSKGEDAGDTVMSGLWIDVKTTRRQNGRLLAPPWKKSNETVDVYALMVGECPTFGFRGFMLASELIMSSKLGDLGYGPTYLASQSELCEWREVLKKKLCLE